MKRQQKRREIPVCPSCHGTGISPDSTRCTRCGATLRWQPDKSLELHVTGVADEVASVTERLAAELTPTAVRTESIASVPPEGVASVSPEGKEHWARSRKIWAFAIGFTTIVGGVAAVLALFIH